MPRKPLADELKAHRQYVSTLRIQCVHEPFRISCNSMAASFCPV